MDKHLLIAPLSRAESGKLKGGFSCVGEFKVDDEPTTNVNCSHATAEHNTNCGCSRCTASPIDKEIKGRF